MSRIQFYSHVITQVSSKLGHVAEGCPTSLRHLRLLQRRDDGRHGLSRRDRPDAKNTPHSFNHLKFTESRAQAINKVLLNCSCGSLRGMFAPVSTVGVLNPISCLRV